MENKKYTGPNLCSDKGRGKVVSITETFRSKEEFKKILERTNRLYEGGIGEILKAVQKNENISEIYRKSGAWMYGGGDSVNIVYKDIDLESMKKIQKEAGLIEEIENYKAEPYFGKYVKKHGLEKAEKLRRKYVSSAGKNPGTQRTKYSVFRASERFSGMKDKDVIKNLSDLEVEYAEILEKAPRKMGFWLGAATFWEPELFFDSFED